MMKERVRKYVPRQGCFAGVLDSCMYINGEQRCAIGAMVPDDVVGRLDGVVASVIQLAEQPSRYGLTEQVVLGPFLTAEEAEIFQAVHDDTAMIWGRIGASCSVTEDLINWIDTNILEDHEA